MSLFVAPITCGMARRQWLQHIQFKSTIKKMRFVGMDQDGSTAWKNQQRRKSAPHIK
ncbi:hypothetical protein HanIR_Chr08g0364211 [Helianthus annuus]|nr:hypothetical protein HanIR_Chr08g0364211 [Helianthus annuus]